MTVLRLYIPEFPLARGRTPQPMRWYMPPVAPVAERDLFYENRTDDFHLRVGALLLFRFGISFGEVLSGHSEFREGSPVNERYRDFTPTV